MYLRARYYDPSVGVFTSLDPFEGMPGRPMSLNGYSWVEGNAINGTDPSGLSIQLTQLLNGVECLSNSTDICVGYMAPSIIVYYDCSNPPPGVVSSANDYQEAIQDIATTLYDVITWNPFANILNNLSNATNSTYYVTPVRNPVTQATELSIQIHNAIFEIISDGLCAFSPDFEDYGTAAQRLLETLASYIAIDSFRHLINFSIYVDDAELPPYSADFMSSRDLPYVIKYNNRTVGNPEPSFHSWINNGMAFGHAAYHVYLEFMFAGTSTIVDTARLTVTGQSGLAILDYFANLQPNPMPWRDCENYRGLTANNVADALSRMPGMIYEARSRAQTIQSKGIPSDNPHQWGCSKPWRN